MGYTTENYIRLLKSLLPRGKAWSRDSGAMPDLLGGVAKEFSRIDNIITNLPNDRDSRYVLSLLPELEADLDLGSSNDSAAFWIDDFAGGVEGEQPAGWYDMRDGIIPDATINYQNTDAKITVQNAGGWAKVVSFSQDIDLDTYDKLKIEIRELQGGCTFRIGVFQADPYVFWDCVDGASISSAGVYDFDLSEITGLTDTQNLAIQLTVEGVQDTHVVVGYVGLYHNKLEERRSICRSILTAMGGQNPQYYIDLAAAMGYTITIEQFRPAWCGIVVCGEGCGNQDVLFVWRVKLLYSDTYPDPTGADLQEVLEELKPAHTTMIFILAGPGFSRGFSSGFDAMPALTAAQLAVGGFRWRGFTKGFDLKYGGGFNYGAFTRGFNNLK